MLRSRIIALVILGGIILPSALNADHRDHLFTTGNQAYQAGDFNAAILAYQKILDTGYTSAAVFYNLANAYFKTGENARAILFYERALKIKPSDEDIRFNLQIARLTIADKIPALPDLFWTKAIRSFRSLFSLNSLSLLLLFLYIVFMGTLIWLMLSRSKAVRRITKSLIFILGFGLTVFTFTFFSKAIDQKKNTEAVIMATQVDARSAPADDSTVIFTIHAGLKVKLVQRRGTWQEIRLPDGKQGWLPVDTYEKI